MSQVRKLKSDQGQDRTDDLWFPQKSKTNAVTTPLPDREFNLQVLMLHIFGPEGGNLAQLD
jgi:hypothetical protein